MFIDVSEFESPTQNPDGSFSKTITVSSEARAIGSITQQEFFNIASYIEIVATNPIGQQECWSEELTVNC